MAIFTLGQSGQGSSCIEPQFQSRLRPVQGLGKRSQQERLALAFGRFQDFLSGLVTRQRGLFFSGSEASSIDELLEKIMGNTGEVSAIVTARQLLDNYNESDDEAKLAFFQKLERDFNANEAVVKLAYENYSNIPSSSNLNKLSLATEPLRHELLRRLNQTPGATHDLVGMRTDLLKLLSEHPHLKAVDEDFARLFSSWFGRGFLLLQTIDWSTSAAILDHFGLSRGLRQALRRGFVACRKVFSAQGQS